MVNCEPANTGQAPNPFASRSSGDEDTSSKKISPEELERKEKKFLDDLESLREEERNLIRPFNLELAEKIFIDNEEETFSFQENLKRFLAELAGVENKLVANRQQLGETEVNQVLSQLRILREKAQTVFNRVREGE